IAATVVFAEHLAEEAPDGCGRAEHSVAIIDAMFIKDVQDAGFSQDIGKRKSLVAREAGADLLQVGHGIVFPMWIVIFWVDWESPASIAATSRHRLVCTGAVMAVAIGCGNSHSQQSRPRHPGRRRQQAEGALGNN